MWDGAEMLAGCLLAAASLALAVRSAADSPTPACPPGYALYPGRERQGASPAAAASSDRVVRFNSGAWKGSYNLGGLNVNLDGQNWFVYGGGGPYAVQRPQAAAAAEAAATAADNRVKNGGDSRRRMPKGFGKGIDGGGGGGGGTRKVPYNRGNNNRTSKGSSSFGQEAANLQTNSSDGGSEDDRKMLKREVGGHEVRVVKVLRGEGGGGGGGKRGRGRGRIGDDGRGGPPLEPHLKERHHGHQHHQFLPLRFESGTQLVKCVPLTSPPAAAAKTRRRRGRRGRRPRRRRRRRRRRQRRRRLNPHLGAGAPEIVAPQIVLPLGKLVEQLGGRANLRQTALVLQPQVVVRGVGGDGGGGGGGGGGRGRGRGVGGFRRRSKYKDVLNGDFGREADGFQAGKGLGLVAELPERGAKSSAAAAAAAAAAEAAEAAKWKDASKFVVESALSGYQQLLGERVLLMSEDCVIAKKKKNVHPCIAKN